MTTLLEARKPVSVGSTMSTQDLQVAAARFIYLGSSGLAPEVLAEAQAEVTQRMAQGESLGLTEREVVLSLLHSVCDRTRHCGCPSCRERCLGCRFRDLSAQAPQEAYSDA